MKPSSENLSHHTFVLLAGQSYEFFSPGGPVTDHLMVSSVAGSAEQSLAGRGNSAVIGFFNEDGRTFVYAAARVDRNADGRPGTKYIHIVECKEAKNEQTKHAMNVAYVGADGVRRFAETQYSANEVSRDAIREMACRVERELRTEKLEIEPKTSPASASQQTEPGNRWWSFVLGGKAATPQARRVSGGPVPQGNTSPVNTSTGGASIVPPVDRTRHSPASGFFAVFLFGVVCGAAVGTGLTLASSLAPVVSIVLFAMSMGCVLAFVAVFKRLDSLKREVMEVNQGILATLQRAVVDPAPPEASSSSCKNDPS